MAKPRNSLPPPPAVIPAEQLLHHAFTAMERNTATRDTGTGERSLPLTVKLFNQLTGHNLDCREAAVFMTCLKLARAQVSVNNGVPPVIDDYIDGAAYLALAGEAVQQAAEDMED